MIRNFLKLLNTETDWRAAKATYGPEILRHPSTVSTNERVEAVLDQFIIGLLIDVQGKELTSKQTSAEQSHAFKHLLPTTWRDVKDYLARNRLPPRYCFYQTPEDNGGTHFLVEQNGSWHFYERERTHAFRVHSGTHEDVALAALKIFRHQIAMNLIDD